MRTAQTSLELGSVVSLLLLSSCVSVPSLFPLYTETDVFFEEELLGEWLDGDGDRWTFEDTGHGDYLVTYQPRNVSFVENESEPGAPALLSARLVQLEDATFLDFYLEDIPLSNWMQAVHVLPVHTFAKVSISEGSVRIAFMSSDWFEHAQKEEAVTIDHIETEDSLLLTAPTSELQEFVRSVADNPKAFNLDDGVELSPDNRTAGFG